MEASNKDTRLNRVSLLYERLFWIFRTLALGVLNARWRRR